MFINSVHPVSKKSFVEYFAAAVITTVFLFILFTAVNEKARAGDEPWPYALWFDGDGDYVDIPVRPRDIDDGPITFSCRLQIAPGAGDERMKIFSGYATRYGDNRWDFEYNFRDSHTLMFSEWGGSWANYGSRKLEEGVWYYVSFVWEPGRRVTLYIDGEKDASFRIENTSLDDGRNFRIAGRPDGTEKEWKGGMRDVALWATARTEEQIREDMRQPPSGDEQVLVGYWPMDEGKGNIAHDRSAGAGHGGIVGAAWAMGENPATLLEKSPRQVVPAFVVAAREHHSSVLRWQAVQGLGLAKTDAEITTPVLLEALKDVSETNQIRLAAVDSLIRLDADIKNMMPALLNILKDAEDAIPVRLQVLNTLTKSDVAADETASALLDILKNSEEEESLRLKAADTLYVLEVSAEDTAPVLLNIVKNSEETVELRLTALAVLNKLDIDPEKMILGLLEVLKDSDDREAVRLEVLNSLLEQSAGKKDVAAALRDVLEQAEGSPAARTAVFLTLKFYRDGLGASVIAPRDLAPPLLKVLIGAENAVQAGRKVLELLGKFDNKLGEAAPASALLSRLKDAENTDGIRLAVLEGTGALEITAEGIDEGAENPYPETDAEIALYKDYVIGGYHQEICLYPEEVTEISTLEELAEYAGKSGVHVRMEPGVYRITPDNYEQFMKEIEEGMDRMTLLNFSGTHSYFDLRGVEIRISSMIGSLSRRSMTEVVVRGDNLIIEGLAIINVGNHASDKGVSTFGSGGDNNLLHDLEITCRGSYPYGYGEGRWIYQHGFSGASKKGAVGAGGNNIVYADIKIRQRASGHALTWPGHGNQTFIDCHVEGQVRLTDDILAEISEPGYGPRFDDRDFNLHEKHESGRMTPMCEDAYRSYGTIQGGSIKILGGTVKNVRNVFIRGNYDTSFISNVRVLRKWGFHTNHAEKTRIVNSETDLLFGQFLVIYGGEGREVDLTVVPADTAFLPVEVGHRGGSALINGSYHNVVLRSGGELNIKNPPPIMVNGRDIKLRNETGIPVELTENSRDCQVISKGNVTDNGRGNRVRRLD